MRVRSSSSLVARISAARIPAFVAPVSPTATVATGIPRGICTVERSASRPPAIAFGATSGTPITGSVVSAATAPDDSAGRVAFRRAMEREHVLGHAVETQDGHTRLRRAGIVLGAEHHIHVGTLAEADRLRGDIFREAALAKCE